MGWPPNEPNYEHEPSYDMLDALRLVPLFYTINWTPEKKAEWLVLSRAAAADLWSTLEAAKRDDLVALLKQIPIFNDLRSKK